MQSGSGEWYVHVLRVLNKLRLDPPPGHLVGMRPLSPGQEARDYNQVARKEHLKPLEVMLRMMEDTAPGPSHGPRAPGGSGWTCEGGRRHPVKGSGGREDVGGKGPVGVREVYTDYYYFRQREAELRDTSGVPNATPDPRTLQHTGFLYGGGSSRSGDSAAMFL